MLFEIVLTLVFLTDWIALVFSSFLLFRSGLLEAFIITLLRITLGVQFLSAFDAVTHEYTLIYSLGTSALIILRYFYLRSPNDRIEFRSSSLLFFAVAVICLIASHYDSIIDYDSLTYHLRLPAEFFQNSAISIVPTPFGDNAPAYSPLNAQLVYLWTLLPFQSDVYAHSAQWIYFILVGLAVREIAQHYRVSHGLAFWLWLVALACNMEYQLLSAYVDIATAACFLSAYAYYLDFTKQFSLRSACFFGISIGLMIGTKYIAVALSLPLLFLFSIKALYHQRFLALASSLLLTTLSGGYFYLRNLLVTANPFYPSRVSFGDFVLFQGAFSTEVMRSWVFNHTNKGILFILEMFFDKPGLIAPVLLLFVSLASIRTASSELRRGSVLLLIFAIITFAIVTYISPYQHPRFYFTSFSLLTLSLALVIPFDKTLSRLTLAAITLLYAYDIYLRFDTKDTNLFVSISMLLLSVPILLLYAPKKETNYLSHRHVYSLGGIFLCILLHGSWRLANYDQLRSKFDYRLEAPLLKIAEHSSISNIAYTGNNVPYGLYGRNFKNRVQYVNTNCHQHWKLHDYEKDLRVRNAYQEPTNPEVSFYRDSSSYQCWLNNLDKANIDLLVITRLSPNAQRVQRHDKRGFPVEYQYAKTHPQLFKAIYESNKSAVFIFNKVAPAAIENSQL